MFSASYFCHCFLKAWIVESFLNYNTVKSTWACRRQHLPEMLSSEVHHKTGWKLQPNSSTDRHGTRKGRFLPKESEHLDHVHIQPVRLVATGEHSTPFNQFLLCRNKKAKNLETVLQDATENLVEKILMEQKKQNELPLAKSTSFLHVTVAIKLTLQLHIPHSFPDKGGGRRRREGQQ